MQNETTLKGFEYLGEAYRRKVEEPGSDDAVTQQAAQWYDSCLLRGRNFITTDITMLTPARARQLLYRNPSNRTIVPTLVDNYVRDMQNAAWDLNGETIIVARTGELNNGQHRCLAVIEGNIEVKVIIVWGVDRETRNTVDQGRVKKTADYLAMEGFHNTNLLAAVATLVWQYKARKQISASSHFRPTKVEHRAFVHENAAALQRSISVAGSKPAESVGGKSILAFCHYVFAEKNREAADDFVEALTNGANLRPRDPILYVRNKLINERGRMRPNDKAELIFRAWNAHRRGDEVRSFPVNGGPLPVVAD